MKALVFSLLTGVFCVGINDFGFAQSGYSDIPPAQKSTLFFDDFDELSSKWTATPAGQISVSYGKLNFKSVEKEAAAGCLIEIDFDASEDFEVEAMLRYVSGKKNNALHLIFGKASSAWDRYDLGISADNHYRVDKSENNKFSDFKSWTKSSIVKGESYNKLTVRQAAGYWYFFVNESLVHSMEALPLFGQKFGFQVPANTAMQVDYLRISALSDRKVNEAPEISIVEPDLSRGYLRVDQKVLTVKGFASDENGIYEVMANGIDATLGSNGYFTVDIPLAVGDNSIRLEATDTKLKSSSKTIVVSRASGNTESATNYSPPATVSDKRVALIVGNSNYSGQANLGMNPINDATDMATALRAIGFEVILKTDASLTTLNNAIREFGRQNRDADVALFYFAGHGMQIDRTNYLLPIGVQINDKNDVDFESVSVKTVQRIMETSNEDRLNLIVLDACRNNPFRTWQRGGASGLADMTPPSGTLIAFSTSPGSVASNGAGRNGLYTGELIRQLKVPQRIEDVFINTRVQVEKKSGGNQSPWELARLRGTYYLAR